MVDIEEFLSESNKIEGVTSADALSDAVDGWELIEQHDELTGTVIKDVHEEILKNRQPDIAGVYRTVPVRVGDDRPPAPENVPHLMELLLATTPATAGDALQWHITFEKIHPFTDGNGRIGRLIYLWHCLEHLETTPLIFRAQDRHGYYALFDTAAPPHTRLSQETENGVGNHTR